MCALTHNKQITQSVGQIHCKTVQTSNILSLSEEPVLEGHFEGVLNVRFVLFASPSAWEEPSTHCSLDGHRATLLMDANKIGRKTHQAIIGSPTTWYKY